MLANAAPMSPSASQKVTTSLSLSDVYGLERQNYKVLINPLSLDMIQRKTRRVYEMGKRVRYT